MNSLFPQYKYSKHLMSLSRTFARDFLAVFCIGHAMFRNILIRLLFDVVSFFICFRLFIPVSRNLHYFPALLIAPSLPQRKGKPFYNFLHAVWILNLVEVAHLSKGVLAACEKDGKLLKCLAVFMLNRWSVCDSSNIGGGDFVALAISFL